MVRTYGHHGTSRTHLEHVGHTELKDRWNLDSGSYYMLAMYL
jgi:hypothetical protein